MESHELLQWGAITLYLVAAYKLWNMLTQHIRREERTFARFQTLERKYRRLKKRSNRTFDELKEIRTMLHDIDKRTASWE